MFINKFTALSDSKKSAIAFMFASFVQQAINFLITPLFTRLLSTAEFGVVMIYNSWVEIVGTIAMLSLSAGFFNIGMIDFEDRRDTFTKSILGLSNVATIVVMAVFYILSLCFPSVIQLPISLYLLMTLYFIFYPATRFWIARQRFELKYKKLTLVTVSSAFLSDRKSVV